MNATDAPKVAKEVAEQEFARFASTWDIFTDEESMSQEDKDTFRPLKEKIVRAISRGAAVVSDDGKQIIYTPQHMAQGGDVSPITFNIPKGAAYIGMDSFKDRQSMHKLYSFMSEMTARPAKFFANMDGRDCKFCQAVTALFLGS